MDYEEILQYTGWWGQNMPILGTLDGLGRTAAKTRDGRFYSVQLQEMDFEEKVCPYLDPP